MNPKENISNTNEQNETIPKSPEEVSNKIKENTALLKKIDPDNESVKKLECEMNNCSVEEKEVALTYLDTTCKIVEEIWDKWKKQRNDMSNSLFCGAKNAQEREEILYVDDKLDEQLKYV